MLESIGRYRILATLGRGGTGTVYRVHDPVEEREVALKLFEGPRGGRESELALEEFRVLASHRHEGLVQVYDCGIVPDGRRYFTMELLSGTDIVQYARPHGGAPHGGSPALADVFGQVLAALDSIHCRGIAHLDLKPANIIVEDRRGAPRARLIDFGLARHRASPERELAGTVEYLSPERLRGEPGGAASDLYSLGAVAFEVFTGAPPFTGSTAQKVVEGHLEGKIERPEALPEEYRELILELLEKDPARRPPSARAVLGRLPGGSQTWRRRFPDFSTVFAGRDGVLEHLVRAVLPSGRDRGARTVLLAGPTGIGKSRLLHELRIRAQIEGAAVALDRARGGGERPGSLLRRLVARLGGGDGPDPAAADRNREGFFFRFTEAVFAAAATGPAALLADDLDSADSLSLDALAYLARRMEASGPAGLTLIVAHRTDTQEDQDRARDFRRAAGAVEEIVIGELGRDGVAVYLTQLLGSAEEVPDGLLEQLAREAGGRPLLLEECLKLLGERDAFERRGASWRFRRDAEVAVPRSVGEAATRRVAEVTGLRRDALDALAILSEPLTAEEIESCMGAVFGTTPKAQALVRALAENVADSLLRHDGARYTFAHGALERAAYEAMVPSVRRERHRRAARWLEAQGGIDGAGAIERLARHLYFSDEPRRARGPLLRAAEVARLSGALREASVHFSRALEVCDGAREELECRLGREEILGLLGAKDRQLEDIRRLTALARTLGDAAAEREAGLREALYLDAMGERRQALDALSSLLENAPARGLPEARLLSRMAMLQVFLSDFDGAERSLEEAAGIARRESDRDLEATCLQLSGTGDYVRGAYERAVPLLERALAIRRELRDESRAGALESNIGLIHLDRGDLEAAEERFQRSLKSFRKSGLRGAEAANLVNLGLAYLEMGRLERALDFITESLAIRRELGHRLGIGTDLGNLGAVWMRAGRLERAAPLLEEALRIAEEVENQPSLSLNEARLGLLELERGRLDMAAAHLERAREIAERTGGRPQRLEVLCHLARFSLVTGQSEAALRHAETALEMAAGSGMRLWSLECRSLAAAALLALGELERADAASREAVEELERLPGWVASSQEVWFTRYRVLEALAARGHAENESEAALRRARTLLQEKAMAFEDAALRQAFLENVPLHREIERLHAEADERRRREASHRERSFYDIARSIHSIVELDPLLDRLLELAIETTRAEKGLILLRDADGALTIRAARGMARESVEDAAEICQSVIADVATGGEPVLATDATSDDRFRERRSIISFRIHTLMCVPLTVRDEIIGAVYVDGRGTASFSRDDLEYLVSFGHLAAIAVDNARLLARLRRENQTLRREVETRFRFENLVCHSTAMQQLAAVVEKVARSDASVLITGETGTGKSLIARALHLASRRKDRPFITVDCGALPESLLESELFGHRKGAFSGALYDRVGLIEEAQGGTLFLDEVSNTSLDLQAKLLRVLQEGEIRRVGENQVRKVDVRILAATNVSLRDAVAAGKFREDLFYRLHVVPVTVPRLADRREDIVPLALEFLKRSSERARKEVLGFTDGALRVLERAPWKGNVRELENAIEKAVILTDEDRLSGEFLAGLLAVEPGPETHADPFPVREPTNGDEDICDDVSLERFDRRWLEAERRYLLSLVERTGWNISAAGRLAKVRNRNTFVSRLKKHGLERPPGGADGGFAGR